MGGDLVGKRLGDYDILGVIGRGGMGVVYEARQRSVVREIALKVPHDQFSSDPEFLRRFFLEGRTAQRVHHPSIVDTYAVGAEGDTHYIAMERVRGRPLTMIIRRGKELTVDRSLRIVRQIAQALGEIHKNEFVHRDIKPDNINIDDAWKAKLMDFGIARPINRQQTGVTEASDWLGTSVYLAPELIDGGKPSPQSDIYSLGAVLFEMLTGRVPYGHPDAETLKKMVQNDPVPDVMRLNPEADDNVQLIIDMTLAKDPSDRFASTKELVDDINQALNGLAAKPKED